MNLFRSQLPLPTPFLSIALPLYVGLYYVTFYIRSVLLHCTVFTRLFSHTLHLRPCLCELVLRNFIVNYIHINTPLLFSSFIAGCQTITFPALVETSCTADETCNGLGCCLELDVGVARRSFTIWLKLDLCGMTFYIGFENWMYTESLDAGFHLGIVILTSQEA